MKGEQPGVGIKARSPRRTIAGYDAAILPHQEKVPAVLVLVSVLVFLLAGFAILGGDGGWIGGVPLAVFGVSVLLGYEWAWKLLRVLMCLVLLANLYGLVRVGCHWQEHESVVGSTAMPLVLPLSLVALIANILSLIALQSSKVLGYIATRAELRARKR